MQGNWKTISLTHDLLAIITASCLHIPFKSSQSTENMFSPAITNISWNSRSFFEISRHRTQVSSRYNMQTLLSLLLLQMSAKNGFASPTDTVFSGFSCINCYLVVFSSIRGLYNKIMANSWCQVSHHRSKVKTDQPFIFTEDFFWTVLETKELSPLCTHQNQKKSLSCYIYILYRRYVYVIWIWMLYI